jgi:hypothetical protein
MYTSLRVSSGLDSCTCRRSNPSRVRSFVTCLVRFQCHLLSFFDGGGRGLDFSDIVFVYNLSDMTSKSPTVAMLTKCWLMTYETCWLVYVCTQSSALLHRLNVFVVDVLQYGYKVKVNLSHYRHAGAKGARKYSSYSFLTSALHGGEWSASLPGHDLPPGKQPPVSIGHEAGWASELVWTQTRGKILCLCRGSDPGRPVSIHTLHWLSYPRWA